MWGKLFFPVNLSCKDNIKQLIFPKKCIYWKLEFTSWCCSYVTWYQHVLSQSRSQKSLYMKNVKCQFIKYLKRKIFDFYKENYVLNLINVIDLVYIIPLGCVWGTGLLDIVLLWILLVVIVFVEIGFCREIKAGVSCSVCIVVW